jgi:hypothetical protein
LLEGLGINDDQAVAASVPFHFSALVAAKKAH